MKTPLKFDPWAVLREIDESPANLAKPANATAKPAEISNFSNFSRAASRNFPPSEAEIIDLVAVFEERAAIREYDGKLSRAEAERLAFKDCAPDSEARNRLSVALAASGQSVPEEAS